MIPISNTAVPVHRPERSQVEIADPAKAEEFLEDAYEVRLRLHRKDTGHVGELLKHSRTAVGPFAIEDIYVGGDLEAAPDPLNKVLVIWPTSGRLHRECGGITGDVAAGDLAVLSQPDLPYRARSQDLRMTSVLLEPSMLAGVATGLPTSHAPIRFSTLQPLDPAAVRLWKNTVTYMKDVVLADDALTTPLVLGQAARYLAAVTLSTFPNTFATAPTPHDRTDHQPVLLRRAIEFIDANATNDIALADIAEAVHVTPRAVQYMFRRHLETTPLQYLRRLRLHYAHQDLKAADRAHATVTDIAARWGFMHTGRFAVLYRQTYGCSPHTTLR
ncbi:MAG TPA: AraC family transcriptional regulator [Mycobacterium sp.]|nr:AraC family transcriptional regulator [Mycobacterium sp.]